jgi:imidazolonepropionase-like amidohydrolase
MNVVCLSLVAGVLVPALAFAQARSITIHADTLLDGRGTVLRNQTITVTGSTITSIAPAKGPADCELRGLTVMPGWIDPHVHIDWHFGLNGKSNPRGEKPQEAVLFAAENAYKTLMGGFTTVQSVGSPNDKYLRDIINRGLLPGPRILTSLAALTDQNAGTPEQIRQWVRQTAKDGADLIKIFASGSSRDGGRKSLTDEQIQAACGEARAVGLRAMVHAQRDDAAIPSILAGCQALEHGTYFSDRVLQMIAEHGVYFTPNVGLVSQNYVENKEHFIGTGNYTEESIALTATLIPIKLEMFKRALTIKNLKMPFGTDAVAGAHGRNIEELIARVQQGGQDPGAALIGVTSLAAEALGLRNRIGTLAPGMEADIVAVQGDPLKDVTTLRNPLFIMKGGKVYKNTPVAARAAGM